MTAKTNDMVKTNHIGEIIEGRRETTIDFHNTYFMGFKDGAKSKEQDIKFYKDKFDELWKLRQLEKHIEENHSPQKQNSNKDTIVNACDGAISDKTADTNSQEENQEKGE